MALCALRRPSAVVTVLETGATSLPSRFALGSRIGEAEKPRNEGGFAVIDDDRRRPARLEAEIG
jgi:hypothetical protein